MSASNGAVPVHPDARRRVLRAQRAAARRLHAARPVADDRTDHPLVRLKNVLTIGIAQTKIFRDPVAGAMHATIFWGFMVLTAGTVEILIQGVFPAILIRACSCRSRSISSTGCRRTASRCSSSARSRFAFYRRLVLHPRRLEGDKLEHTDALIILSMIGGLMVTLLLTNACQYLVDPSRRRPGEGRVARAGQRASRPYRSATRRALAVRCSGGCTRC